MHVPIAIEAEPPGLAGILAIFVTLWVYGCGRMSSTELDPPAGPGGTFCDCVPTGGNSHGLLLSMPSSVGWSASTVRLCRLLDRRNSELLRLLSLFPSLPTSA